MVKRVLIVDDEKIARDRMLRFLASYPEKFDVAEAENGVSALRNIHEMKPDVVFLDIQMPVMTGFDVLYQLQDRNFQVVFQTAYDEFAVQAFEVNACDYLLKPYPEEKFHAALKKALLAQTQQERLLKLEEHLKHSHTFLKTVVSRKGPQTKLIDIDDVQYFKSEDHYTFAVLDKSEFIIDLSLGSLEAKLDPNKFVRSHRNCLVKKSAIEVIGGAESPTLRLRNGTEVPVSREGRKKILHQLKL